MNYNLKNMKLTEKQKEAITKEYNGFQNYIRNEYNNNSQEKRDELGQFYTPPEVTIQMIEMFDCTLEDLVTKTICDPTAGSGNLLAACIMAGVDPNNIYANEYDEGVVENILRPRLNKLGVPNKNIHVGNVFNRDCLNIWSDEYKYDSKKNRVVSDKKFSLNKR